MSGAFVSERCGLCNRVLEDGEQAAVLEDVFLTREPLSDRKMKDDAMRVKRIPGAKPVWCYECAVLALDRLPPLWQAMGWAGN